MSKVIQNIKELASLGLQACAERDALQAELTALHAKNDRLSGAFLANLQSEDMCTPTGVACRADGKCACAMEMVVWLKKEAK